MNKLFSFLLAAMLMAGSFSVYASEDTQNHSQDNKIHIVTTIFPEYDWVMNVLGDNPAGAEVSMLLDSGVDLHSYQPTAEDILKITTCDLFIYVGGESDEWVDDALKEAVNKDMIVINMLDALGDSVKEEEVIEGMQEEEHDHEHDEDTDEEDHDNEHEEDEVENVDLTTLSSTMVYSEVYNMLVSPENYIGKTVKMDGLFALYHDETTDNYYFACIVADATACCSQGIEFVLKDDYNYPDDYPTEGGEICVIGEFDTYQEAGYTYCTLRDAELV